MNFLHTIFGEYMMLGNSNQEKLSHRQGVATVHHNMMGVVSTLPETRLSLHLIHHHHCPLHLLELVHTLNTQEAC